MWMPRIALWLAAIMLSLGFDMTHPPLVGIATSLDPHRLGQAMGLNAFVLFMGFGIGSIAFGAIAAGSMNQALLIFATVQGSLAILAIPLFQHEHTHTSQDANKPTFTV